MLIDGSRPPVPARALILSVLSLAAPVAAVLVVPDWTQGDQGMLIWLAALIPAFLLAYYRGSEGVAMALAGGMAVITATQVGVAIWGITEPDWGLLLTVVVIYLGISLGIALLAEVLRNEREAAHALALIDRLTGLPNRRHAEIVLEAEFAAAARGSDLSVVLFDLDNFKQVNDRQGHAAGDRALKAFAELLLANTRRESLSARLGGEEFISVIRDCKVEGATRFANRVRQALADLELEWGALTVSAGIASYQQGMGSWEVLVAAADRALYEAKKLGRNRVEVAEAVTAAAPEYRRVAAREIRPPELAPTGQSVIVIDDDPALLDSLTRVLERWGYEVHPFTNPLKVVERAQAGDLDGDVIITDVMMPGMSGLTLIDRLSEHRDDLRVIYMTGDLQKQVDWAGMPGAVVSFLEKPIQVDRLLETVKQVAGAER